MNVTSTALMMKALDGLSLRQEAIAQNVANAGTAGYRPVQVSFESALRAAADQGPAAVSAVAPRLEAAPFPGVGEALRLDLELASASETALRYSALVDLIGRQLQLARTAIGSL